ncbi:hypothetical protein BX661DRAFT_70978 [Kickxella alabastrina]|uniref:uncharacterized protein n=1 Tax=Kickxella alabastrina TaxID=61397 RepID=UPI0022203147|nr:uncharacterized protein BX661DRAFT_70978 [Kickxella alabastrina]KAI7820358.1 hypothetical protein BX661DRAFT_70978 [Kickxella alabastrina]
MGLGEHKRQNVSSIKNKETSQHCSSNVQYLSNVCIASHSTQKIHVVIYKKHIQSKQDKIFWFAHE